MRLPSCSALFPYTTLFRSHRSPPDLRRTRPDADRNTRQTVWLHERRTVLPLHPYGAVAAGGHFCFGRLQQRDRKSTRLNSSHSQISYAVFCLKKKTIGLVM